MEKSKIDMYLGMNSDNFTQSDLMVLKQQLEKVDDNNFFMVQSSELQNPNTIFMIAVLLGWERFWLDDTAMGILKVLTCGGCGIWWFIDMFSAKERARKYNFNKVMSKLRMI